MKGRPLGWIILTGCLGVGLYALAEDLTLTTYYPSPRGVYQELRASGNVAIGYQAGVSDVGSNDKIINNGISGLGYTAPGNAATFAAPIDADPSFTNQPKVHANK